MQCGISGKFRFSDDGFGTSDLAGLINRAKPLYCSGREGTVMACKLVPGPVSQIAGHNSIYASPAIF
ncbi:hypothetical protein AUS31_19660 [Escherichia coli]|nr:hypothetical protein AUS31_19660 [Escherichia coli]